MFLIHSICKDYTMKAAIFWFTWKSMGNYVNRHIGNLQNGWMCKVTGKPMNTRSLNTVLMWNNNIKHVIILDVHGNKNIVIIWYYYYKAAMTSLYTHYLIQAPNLLYIIIRDSLLVLFQTIYRLSHPTVELKLILLL